MRYPDHTVIHVRDKYGPGWCFELREANDCPEMKVAAQEWPNGEHYLADDLHTCKTHFITIADGACHIFWSIPESLAVDIDMDFTVLGIGYPVVCSCGKPIGTSKHHEFKKGDVLCCECGRKTVAA